MAQQTAPGFQPATPAQAAAIREQTSQFLQLYRQLLPQVNEKVYLTLQAKESYQRLLHAAGKLCIAQFLQNQRAVESLKQQVLEVSKEAKAQHNSLNTILSFAHKGLLLAADRLLVQRAAGEDPTKQALLQTLPATQHQLQPNSGNAMGQQAAAAAAAKKRAGGTAPTGSPSGPAKGQGQGAAGVKRGAAAGAAKGEAKRAREAPTAPPAPAPPGASQGMGSMMPMPGMGMGMGMGPMQGGWMGDASSMMGMGRGLMPGGMMPGMGSMDATATAGMMGMQAGMMGMPPMQGMGHMGGTNGYNQQPYPMPMHGFNSGAGMAGAAGTNHLLAPQLPHGMASHDMGMGQHGHLMQGMTHRSHLQQQQGGPPQPPAPAPSPPAQGGMSLPPHHPHNNSHLGMQMKTEDGPMQDVYQPMPSRQQEGPMQILKPLPPQPCSKYAAIPCKPEPLPNITDLQGNNDGDCMDFLVDRDETSDKGSPGVTAPLQGSQQGGGMRLSDAGGPPAQCHGPQGGGKGGMLLQGHRPLSPGGPPAAGYHSPAAVASAGLSISVKHELIEAAADSREHLALLC